MLNMIACKPLDDELTIEEQWVLKVLCSKPIMVIPKDYYVKMIETIQSAIYGNGETMGFLIQLAKIHPELCHAVNCLINGNLEKRYEHQKAIKELGY